MHVAGYKLWGNGDSVQQIPNIHKWSTLIGDNPLCYRESSFALENSL